MGFGYDLVIVFILAKKHDAIYVQVDPRHDADIINRSELVEIT